MPQTIHSISIAPPLMEIFNPHHGHGPNKDAVVKPIQVNGVNPGQNREECLGVIQVMVLHLNQNHALGLDQKPNI